MIASVSFRNFKALRNAQVRLTPFNLVIGPNGSGKSSLIEALLRLRTLARTTTSEDDVRAAPEQRDDNPEISFTFSPPYDGWEGLVSCRSEEACDLLQLIPLPRGDGLEHWPRLRQRLQRTRLYVFDHNAIARGVATASATELAGDGSNLAAVLAHRAQATPDAYRGWCDEVVRILPEYAEVRLDDPRRTGGASFRLADGGDWVPLKALSQGSLFALALLALAHDPDPPAIVCIEELDRGLHPRLLRETRDALYRLSYPDSFGLSREPTQVIVTTHSPYLLDLFREHPEEVIIADKQGAAATFSRLGDRGDLADLLAESSLGDLWYTGILGGVPDAR